MKPAAYLKKQDFELGENLGPTVLVPCQLRRASHYSYDTLRERQGSTQTEEKVGAERKVPVFVWRAGTASKRDIIADLILCAVHGKRCMHGHAHPSRAGPRMRAKRRRSQHIQVQMQKMRWGAAQRRRATPDNHICNGKKERVEDKG